MNELTKKMQEIMVPKAALIAYEYRESAYATGKITLSFVPSTRRAEWKRAFRSRTSS